MIEKFLNYSLELSSRYVSIANLPDELRIIINIATSKIEEVAIVLHNFLKQLSDLNKNKEASS